MATNNPESPTVTRVPVADLDGTVQETVREIISLATAAEAQVDIDAYIDLVERTASLRSHLRSITNIAVKLIDQLAYERGQAAQDKVLQEISRKLDDMQAQQTHIPTMRRLPVMPCLHPCVDRNNYSPNNLIQ